MTESCYTTGRRQTSFTRSSEFELGGRASAVGLLVMGRKKQKVPTPLAALLAIAVSVTAMPLRQVVDPKYVDTNSFTHVDLPDSGAVKQYPTNSGHFHRRGKFHISLRYKPNLKIKKWQTRKNLCRLEDDEPYTTEAEAQREVVEHMMLLEGFTKEGANYYESSAMVKARENEEEE
ncbi:MAG: hypothetical protein VYC68_01750 [Candidatus Thermoplasmatota archaeon]|nr:hypothetical protein [Candidatus Thermoplasmatota archaeon]